jgi:hypothetical protein
MAKLIKWRVYQEEVADLFRSLGYTAEVEKQVTGSRATHAIDVWVTLKVSGIDIKWAVECKAWKSAVPKEKVAALVYITQDVGADRAFLLSESSFQSGAIQAARNTNVTLTSIAELRELIKEDALAKSLFILAQHSHSLQQRLHKLLNGDYRILGVIDAEIGSNLVDLLARVFSIKVISMPHLQAGEYPVTIDFDKIVDNAEQAVTEVSNELTAIDKQVVEIEANASHIYASSYNEVNSLTKLVAELFAEGEKLFFGLHQNDDSVEQARISALAIMKRIGAKADQVKQLTAGRIASDFHRLMGALIDGPYLDLTMLTVERQRWDESCKASQQALDKLIRSASSAFHQ